MRWLRTRRRTILLMLPALALAGFGLVHPHSLDAHSAQWWSDLHILLLPIFPLLGVSQWFLLDVAPTPLRWVGRLAAFGYATFYSGLDAVAGIAAGTAVHAQGRRGGVELAVFQVGDRLGYIGSACFLIASVAIVVAIARQSSSRPDSPHGSRPAGTLLATGGFLLLVASALFLTSHIFWPLGVFTMLGIAAGMALLDLATVRATAVTDRR